MLDRPTDRQTCQHIELLFAAKNENFVLVLRGVGGFPHPLKPSSKFPTEIQLRGCAVPTSGPVSLAWLQNSKINFQNPTQQQLNLTRLRLDIIIKPNPPSQHTQTTQVNYLGDWYLDVLNFNPFCDERILQTECFSSMAAVPPCFSVTLSL